MAEFNLADEVMHAGNGKRGIVIGVQLADDPQNTEYQVRWYLGPLGPGWYAPSRLIPLLSEDDDG